MKKRMKRLSAVSIIIIMAASLTGCRVSPALIDPVYTADAAEVDPDQVAADFNDEDGAAEDEAPQTRQEEEAQDHNAEQEQAAGLQEDGAEDDAPSRAQDSSSTENEDLETSGGDGESEAVSGNPEDDTAENSGNGNSETESDGNSDGNPESGNNNGDDKVPSDDDDDTETYPVKDGEKKTVTDASGTEQTIPEDVYTVTAVGAAAPIVTMVGGTSRLLGTSESFVSNEIGSMILAGESDTQVNVWWSGDGSGQISDSDFQELLKASPDVCFEISGEGTFSSDQIAKLQELGIGYLVLPRLSSSGNIKQAVQIVAEALETNESTGQAASVIAQNYCDWVDEALSFAGKTRKAETYYSLYISDWREDVSYQRMFDPGYDERGYIVDFPESSGVRNGQGQGVATASIDVDGMPFFEFWEQAGIRDTLTMQLHEGNNYYLGVSFIATAEGYEECTEMYIFPYEHWFGLPSFSDSNVFSFYENVKDQSTIDTSVSSLYSKHYSVSWGLSTGWYTSVTDDLGQGDPENHLGGSDRYKAIVVANDYVKSMISSSPQWKAGFLDGVVEQDPEDEFFYRGPCDIAGDYDIYVNPTGLGNWAEGSVESPLETYWVLCKISGAISEDRLKTEVRSFYSDFFGITLSDSQINDLINS